MHIKCIKSKGHERNTTCRRRVSGVTKLKGLYTRYLCDGAYLRAVFSSNAIRLTDGL